MKSGFAFIDKPSDMTSHDVVNQVRRSVGTKKVGHAGTLDPFATGLLILGVNKATRLLAFLLGLDKSYIATMRLGEVTDTDDLTGTVVSKASAFDLDEVTILKAVTAHIGTQMQMPSTYSAKKVDGVRAYEKARRGEDVSLTPKQITISNISNVRIQKTHDGIDVEFEVSCSSGTYIRALARDVGQELLVGGHLRALRRVSIGAFSIAEATSIESISIRSMQEICQKVMPVHQIDSQSMSNVRFGKPLELNVAAGVNALIYDDEVVAVIEKQDDMIFYRAVLADV